VFHMSFISSSERSIIFIVSVASSLFLVVICVSFKKRSNDTLNTSMYFSFSFLAANSRSCTLFSKDLFSSRVWRSLTFNTFNSSFCLWYWRLENVFSLGLALHLMLLALVLLSFELSGLSNANIVCSWLRCDVINDNWFYSICI
jgi:hypothetical protein